MTHAYPGRVEHREIEERSPCRAGWNAQRRFGTSTQVGSSRCRRGRDRFSWLSRGHAVFVKPALNSGRHYPATTSPVAIGAMVELLLEKGAGRVIVGDMAGIQLVKLRQGKLSGSTRRLMMAAGIAKAALAAGAELHFFEEAGWEAFYEDMPSEGSNWAAGLMMPNEVRSSRPAPAWRRISSGCSMSRQEFW